MTNLENDIDHGHDTVGRERRAKRGLLLFHSAKQLSEMVVRVTVNIWHSQGSRRMSYLTAHLTSQLYRDR